IMWSHSTGAEVMKPLATPVLGGMVSSLGLVLIVTPVLFSWLREQDLRRAEREARGHHPNHEPRPTMGPAGWRKHGGWHGDGFGRARASRSGDARWCPRRAAGLHE